MFHSMVQLQSGMMEELYRAAQAEDTEQMKTLLRRGATVNSASAQRRFVQLAASIGDQELLKMFLQRGMALSDPSCSLEALHDAAEDGDAELVELLLEHGARPYVNDVIRDVKDTALHLAVRGGHLKATQVLLNHCADVSSLSSTRRCSYGEQDTFDFFVDEKVTPLHIAAEEGHFEVAKALLAKGPDINASTEHGYTPLHLAVNENRDDIVRLLLEQGAKLSLLTEEGESVVDIATRRRHYKILKTLEEHMMIVMIASELRYEEEERLFASSRVKRLPKRKQSKAKAKTSKQMRTSGEENGHSTTTTVVHERQTSNGTNSNVHDSTHKSLHETSQDNTIGQGQVTGGLILLKVERDEKDRQFEGSGDRSSIVNKTVVSEVGSAPRAISERDTTPFSNKSTLSAASGNEGQHVTGGLILLKVEKADERTLWRQSTPSQGDESRRPESSTNTRDRPDGMVFSSFHTMGTGTAEDSQPEPSSPNSSFNSLEDRPIIDCSVKQQPTKTRARSVEQDSKDSRYVPKVSQVYFRKVKGVSFESQDSTEQAEEDERYHDAREYHKPKGPVDTYVTAYKTYSSYIYPIPPTIPYADEHIDDEQSPNIRYRDKTDDEIFYELCEAQDTSMPRPPDGERAEARWTQEGDIEIVTLHQQNIEPISDVNGNYQDTTQVSIQVSTAPEATISADETSDEEDSQFQDALSSLQEVTPLIPSEENLESASETPEAQLEDSDEEYLNDRTMKAAISLMQNKYSYGSQELVTSDTASQYEEADFINNEGIKPVFVPAEPTTIETGKDESEEEAFQSDEDNSTFHQETVTVTHESYVQEVQGETPFNEEQYLYGDVQNTIVVDGSQDDSQTPRAIDEDVGSKEEWTTHASYVQKVQGETPSDEEQYMFKDVQNTTIVVDNSQDVSRTPMASDKDVGNEEEWTTHDSYVYKVKGKTPSNEVKYMYEDVQNTIVVDNSQDDSQTPEASDEDVGSEEEWTTHESYKYKVKGETPSDEVQYMYKDVQNTIVIDGSQNDSQTPEASDEDVGSEEEWTTHGSYVHKVQEETPSDEEQYLYEDVQNTTIVVENSQDDSQTPEASDEEVESEEEWTILEEYTVTETVYVKEDISNFTPIVSNNKAESVNEYEPTETSTTNSINAKFPTPQIPASSEPEGNNEITLTKSRMAGDDRHVEIVHTNPDLQSQRDSESHKETHKQQADSDQAEDERVLSYYYKQNISKDKEITKSNKPKTDSVIVEQDQRMSDVLNDSDLQSQRDSESHLAKEPPKEGSRQDYYSTESFYTPPGTGRIVPGLTEVSIPQEDSPIISNSSIHDDSLEFIDEDHSDITVRLIPPVILKEEKEAHKPQAHSNQAEDEHALSYHFKQNISKEKDISKLNKPKTDHVIVEQDQRTSDVLDDSEQDPGPKDVRRVISMTREKTWHGVEANDGTIGQSVLQPSITPPSQQGANEKGARDAHSGSMGDVTKEYLKEDINVTYVNIIKPEHEDKTLKQQDKPSDEIDDEDQDESLYNSGKTIQAVMSYMSRKYDYDSGKDSSDDDQDTKKLDKSELSTFEIPMETTHTFNDREQHRIQTKPTEPKKQSNTSMDRQETDIRHTTSVLPKKVTIVTEQSNTGPIITSQMNEDAPKSKELSMKKNLNDQGQVQEATVTIDPNTITPIKAKKKKKKKPSRPSRRILAEQEQGPINDEDLAQSLKTDDTIKPTPDNIPTAIHETMPGGVSTTSSISHKPQAKYNNEKNKDAMKKKQVLDIIAVSRISTDIPERTKTEGGPTDISISHMSHTEDNYDKDKDAIKKKPAIEIISISRLSTDTSGGKSYPIPDAQIKLEKPNNSAEEEYIMDAVANTDQSEIVAKIDQIIIESLSPVKGKYKSERLSDKTSPEWKGKQKIPTEETSEYQKEHEALIRHRFSGRPTEIDSLMQYVHIGQSTIQQQQPETHIEHQPPTKPVQIEAIDHSVSGDVHGISQQISTTDQSVQPDTPEKKVRKKTKEKKEKKEKKVKTKQSKEHTPIVTPEGDAISSAQVPISSSTIETTVVIRKKEMLPSPTNDQDHKSEADRQSLIRVTNLDDYMNLYNPSVTADNVSTTSDSAGNTLAGNTSSFSSPESPQNALNVSLSRSVGGTPKVSPQGSGQSNSSVSSQRSGTSTSSVCSPGSVESSPKLSYPKHSKSKLSVNTSTEIPPVSVGEHPRASSQRSAQSTSNVSPQPFVVNTPNLGVPRSVGSNPKASTWGSAANTLNISPPRLAEGTPKVSSHGPVETPSIVSSPRSGKITSSVSSPGTVESTTKVSYQGPIQRISSMSTPKSVETSSNVKSRRSVEIQPNISSTGLVEKISEVGSNASVEDTSNAIQPISVRDSPRVSSWGSATRTSNLSSPRSRESIPKVSSQGLVHRTSIASSKRPDEDTADVSLPRTLEISPIVGSQRSIDNTPKVNSQGSVQRNSTVSSWRTVEGTPNVTSTGSVDNTSTIGSSKLVEHQPMTFSVNKHASYDQPMDQGQHLTSDILNSANKKEISPQTLYPTKDLEENKYYIQAKMDQVPVPPKIYRGNDDSIQTSKAKDASTTVVDSLLPGQHQKGLQDGEEKVTKKKSKSKDKDKKKKSKKSNKTATTGGPQISESMRDAIADMAILAGRVQNIPPQNLQVSRQNRDLASVKDVDKDSVSPVGIVATNTPEHDQQQTTQQTTITTQETSYSSSRIRPTYAEETTPQTPSKKILRNSIKNTPTIGSPKSAEINPASSLVSDKNTPEVSSQGSSQSTSIVSSRRSVENTSHLTSAGSLENTSQQSVTNNSDVGSQGSIANISNASSPGSKKTFVLTIIGHKSATGTHHTPEISFEDSHRPHRQGAFHENRQPKHDHTGEPSVYPHEGKPVKSTTNETTPYKVLTTEQHTRIRNRDSNQSYGTTKGPDGLQMAPVTQHQPPARYSGKMDTSYGLPMEQSQYQTKTFKAPNITTSASLNSSYQKERSHQREYSAMDREDKNYNIHGKMDQDQAPPRDNPYTVETLKGKDYSRNDVDDFSPEQHPSKLQDGQGMATKKKSKSKDKDKKKKSKKSKKKSVEDSPGESTRVTIADEEILAGQGEDIPTQNLQIPTPNRDLARVNDSDENAVSPEGIAATSTPEHDQQYVTQQTTITTQDTSYSSSRIGSSYSEETTPHRPSVQILPFKRRKLSEKDPEDEDADKENQGFAKREAGLLRKTSSQSGMTTTSARPPPHSRDRRSARQTDDSFTSPREAAKKSRPMSVPDVYVLVKFDKGSLSNLGVVNKDDSIASGSSTRIQQNVSFQTDPHFLDNSEASQIGFDDSDLRTKSMDELDIDRPPRRTTGGGDQGLTRSQSGGALDAAPDVGWGLTQQQPRAGYRNIVMPDSYLGGSPIARSNQVYRGEDHSRGRAGQSGVQFKPHDQVSVYHSQTHVGSPNYVQVTAMSRAPAQRPPRPRNRSLSTEPSPVDPANRAPRPRPRSAHEPRQVHQPRQAVSVDKIPQEIHMPIPKARVSNQSHSKSLTWGDSRETIDYQPVEVAMKASPVTPRHQQRPTSMPEQHTPYVQVQPSGVKHGPTLGRVPQSHLKGSSHPALPQVYTQQGYDSPAYQQRPQYASAQQVTPQQQRMTISPMGSATAQGTAPRQRVHMSTTRTSPGAPQYPMVLPSEYKKRTSDPTGLRGRSLQPTPPQDDETDIW